MLSPNNNDNIYLVNYIPGTRGAMIMSLLWQYLVGSSSDPIFSRHGNSHHTLGGHSNYFWFTDVKNPRKTHYLVPRYQLVKQRDPLLPFIIHEHAIPDYDSILRLFPNIRIITVKIDVDDLPVICSLLYFKVYIDMSSGTISKEEFICNKLVEMDKEVVEYYTNPTIPGSLKNKSLVINFKDILKPQLLDTLSEFTNKHTTEPIKDYYSKYCLAQVDQN